MKPILKYPGAKWAIASWIHQYTPIAYRVIDVYGGSGAFLLTLPYHPTHTIYNDLNGDLVNFFRVLRDPAQRDALILMASFTPWSREEYVTAIDSRGRVVPSGDPIEDARRFLIGTWMQHGANTAARNGWRNQGTKDRSSHTWETWRKLPDRLRLVADRLMCAEIECVPALDLMRRHATPSTLMYVDPPYMRTSVHGTRKRMYQHEMTDVDHAALLQQCLAHPGMCMVSGYETELYAKMLKGWTCVTCDTRADSASLRREHLWLNPAVMQAQSYGPLFEESVCQP